MLTLFLIAGLAAAGGPECIECCRAAGLISCKTRVRAHGDGSHITKESGAWRVSGIWWLDCDKGATYDDGATVAMVQRPMAGQILRMASPVSSVACFAKHCVIPKGACLRAAANTGEFVLSRCQDNTMLSEAAMKVLGSSPAAPAPVPTPAPADPNALDLSLPPPATRCAASDALMQAAKVQVDAARPKLKAGDLTGAAKTYRAALTIDPCCAGGWAGLGAVALASGANDTAITALEKATGLKAKVPEFWFLLGKAYAVSGQTNDAIAAFDQVLALDPGHIQAETARKILKPSD